MLYKLHSGEFPSVRALLAPLDYNLSILSLLGGKTKGQIYVDHPTHPATALVKIGHHLFLAGQPASDEFIQGARHLLELVIIPQDKAAGHDLFMVHSESDAWQAAAQAILEGRYPLVWNRQYFECRALLQDWRPLLPPGFELTAVNSGLLARTQLKHLDYLKDELCSERASIEDFLENSFGFAILHDSDLASWCLSEYNQDGRCEVGVATVDEYQRRGLATIASLALVEHAFKNGYQRIGWHCWSWNTASSALARRSGFDLIRDYPVYFCQFDLAVQFSLYGYNLRRTGDNLGALAWYQKANMAGSAPAWADFELACCLAHQGQLEQALAALHQALTKGFDNLEAVKNEPDLDALKKLPDWDTIIEKK